MYIFGWKREVQRENRVKYKHSVHEIFIWCLGVLLKWTIFQEHKRKNAPHLLFIKKLCWPYYLLFHLGFLLLQMS